MSVDPADWEALQYELHPFPDYVNYLLGRPTAFQEATEEQNGDGDLNSTPSRQVHFDAPVHMVSSNIASSAAQGFSAHPNQLADWRIGAGGGNVAENAPARNGMHAPQSSLSNSNPASNSNPRDLRPLAPGELLRPEFAWVSDDARRNYDAHITNCFNTTMDSTESAESRAAAYKYILALSNHVRKQKAIYLEQQARQDQEARERRFWHAMRARSQFRPGDPQVPILESHIRNAISGMGEAQQQYCIELMRRYHHPGTSTLSRSYSSIPPTSHHMQMYRQQYANGHNGSSEASPPQYSSTSASSSALESELPEDQTPPVQWPENGLR